MARLADHDQRERAKSDLDTTFLVEAAAGTGKTTLLVDRILSLLTTGETRLRRIAAITFTEKAAGELKLRLREKIEETLGTMTADGATADERAPFVQALTDLDVMAVATVHAFCADLIRQRPVEAGVDPGFSVADALTSDLVLRETWEAWLADEMVPENDVLRRAVEGGVSFQSQGRDASSLFKLVRAVVEDRDIMPHASPAPVWTDEEFADAAARAKGMAAELGTLKAEHCTNPDDKRAARIDPVVAWGEAEVAAEPEAVCAWFDARPGINLQGGSKKSWSCDDGHKRVGDMEYALRDLHREVRIQLYQHPILVDLFRWIQPFAERYAEAKAERHLLDFGDLLLVARDLLRDQRAVREDFKRSWDYLLVDEFQDTDPLQTEIVFFLAERRGACAAEWREAELTPGKLFLVGDPKQSIYGFRRADLDLYGQVRERVAQLGDVLYLRVNFRTVGEVVTEVNRLFEPLMAGPVDGRFEPGYVALEPHRTSDGRALGLRFISPPDGLDTPTNVTALRRNESGAIAACIQDLIKRGVEVFDKNAGDGAGAWRPVRYGDIGILFRGTTGLPQLEEALRAHNVPYQVAGGKHYYDRLEFRDLFCVLKAIENPYDRLNVIGALRSPFFGHSDEDLLQHFAAAGHFNYLEDPTAAFPDLTYAFTVLRELHGARNTLPAPSLLRKLFGDTQALQVYAMKPHGEQRVANLLKVADMARALAGMEVLSFGALVRWLEQMQSEGQAEGESPVAEEGDDLVSLLTFHKAKGLEFPVVFLAHLGVEGGRPPKSIYDHATKQVALNLAAEMRTSDWAVAYDDRRDREEHERRRLFYVATTRARDLLVVPAYWSKDVKSGSLGYVARAYPLEKGAPATGGSPQCDEALCISTEGYAIDAETRDRFVMKPRIGETLSPEARAFYNDRVAWHADLVERASDLNQGRVIVTPSEKASGPAQPLAATTSAGEGGRAIGTLVHAILERVDFAAPEGIEQLAGAAAVGLDLPADGLDTACDLARKAVDLLAERVAAAREVHREVPFVAPSGEGLVEGIVDLILLEEDGAAIVDYKTDRVAAADAPAYAETYHGQGEAYVRAMRHILPVPVKEMSFLFLHSGVSVAMDIGNDA